MAEQKKQNFLQGTALLAAATVIVKLVGALYKVPLNAIIGEKGFGYFSTAYEIYNILLMISTAGLPVAMSRMISQASSLEHYGQVRQVYSTANFAAPWHGSGTSRMPGRPSASWAPAFCSSAS